jgi:acyl-CoA dehydrogenase
VLDNFPSRIVAWLLRASTFTFGYYRELPSDELSRACADLLLEPSATRDRLTGGIFIGGEADPVGMLDRALAMALVAEPIERKLRAAGGGDIDAGETSGTIDADEARTLREFRSLLRSVLAVDDFAPEELSPAASAGAATSETGDQPSPVPRKRRTTA